MCWCVSVHVNHSCIIIFHCLVPFPPPPRISDTARVKDAFFFLQQALQHTAEFLLEIVLWSVNCLSTFIFYFVCGWLVCVCVCVSGVCLCACSSALQHKSVKVTTPFHLRSRNGTDVWVPEGRLFPYRSRWHCEHFSTSPVEGTPQRAKGRFLVWSLQ